MTVDTIIIPQSVKESLIQHANDELPNECCGYVTGVENRAKTVYRMTNVDASPVHFSFEPKEQFQVIKAARSNGEVPVMVYHSHPESPAWLSNEDLRLLNDPNMIYLIISLEDNTPDLKAYRVVNKSVSDVAISYVKDAK